MSYNLAKELDKMIAEQTNPEKREEKKREREIEQMLNDEWDDHGLE